MNWNSLVLIKRKNIPLKIPFLNHNVKTLSRKKRFDERNSFTEMSLMSKVTLLSACALSVGIIGYVHYKQWSDKEKLHEGVLRDVERQRRRKIDNLYYIEKQAEMTKILKKQQDQDDAVAFQLLEDSKKKT